MRFKLAAALALSALSAGVSAPATAAVYVFSAGLSGSQENPAVASPGTGSTLVTLDDVASTLRVQTVFSGLLGNSTASHIHCCAPFGTNAGVATTTPSFPGFPLGVTAGVMDQTYDMTLASSYRSGFITDNGGTVASAFSALEAGMLAGQSYLNIHSTAFPGGEIRGQLALVVPELSTWVMMIVGFGLIGGIARRRAPAPSPC
ncbi:MAG: CHRD domain-containing protein [Novosphingobium sp.]|nr:CHRD domain-containing protein [Novosphingobium sp.]